MSRLMNKVKVVIDEKAIGNLLLKGNQMLNLCDQKGKEIASKSQGNYKVDTQINRKRIHTRVSVNDDQTMILNYNNNTLLKTIESMKGRTK